MSKVSRRKFIYTGAGLAAAAGVGYLTKDHWLPQKTQTVTPSSTSIVTPSETMNNPPSANFDLVRPKFIKPCVGQEVQFINKSKDEDGDSLTYKWYIDNRFETDTLDFTSNFNEPGTHNVKLEVSDGKIARTNDYSVDIEPDQLTDYPTKTLHVDYKGINYYAVGIRDFSSFYTKSEDRMADHFHTIRNELGCNAIIITGNGNAEDHIIESSKLALEKGFERIYVHPRYISEDIDVTLEKLVKFAPKVKELREESSKYVFLFGREFSVENSGIIRGSTWFDRLGNLSEGVDWGRVRGMLGPFISKAIRTLNESYGYELAYSAGVWEVDFVPWKNSALESVMTNAYMDEIHNQNKLWVMNHLNNLKRHGKPVISSEWGCFAIPGGSRLGGAGGLYNPRQQPENQKEQADYIIKYSQMLNDVKISGSYYVLYDDPYPQSEGLVNANKRRLGFYAYKSYQRIGS